MIALWMLYAAIIGCLMAAAAHALEHLVAQYGWSRRWVWLIAMAALPVVPLLTRSASMAPIPASTVRDVPARAVARPGLASAATPGVTRAAEPSRSPLASGARTVAAGTARIARSAVAVAAMPAVMVRRAQAYQEHLAPLDRPLAWAWAALSALLVGIYAVAAVTLRRQRRRWPAAQVDGEPVLVAPNAGPAVVGLLRPAIVLPAWTLGIDATSRALILRHEREHMRARDPLVLHFVTVTTYLVPWNLAMWWMLRRLRIAVELDCDRRVLLAGYDAHRYADLLLAVGRRRARASRLLVPALVERRSLLARRILAMCPQRAKFQRLRSAGAAGAAYLMFAAAFAIPMPALKTLARPAAKPSVREARVAVLGGQLTIVADSMSAPLFGGIRLSPPDDARPQVSARRPARSDSRSVQLVAQTTEAPVAMFEGVTQLVSRPSLQFNVVIDSGRGHVMLRTKSEAYIRDTLGVRVVVRSIGIQQLFGLQDSDGAELVPATLPNSVTLDMHGFRIDSADVSNLVADSSGSVAPSIGNAVVRVLASLTTVPFRQFAVAMTDSAPARAAHNRHLAPADSGTIAINVVTRTTSTFTMNTDAIFQALASGVKTAPPAVHP